jgi:hypothetical protein
MLPIGAALNIWGNTLYDTPHRTAGWIVFVGGFALVLNGRRAWQGFVDNWRIPERAHHWVAQKWDEPKWRQRWGYLKLTTWGLVVLGVVLYAWKLLNRIAQEPDRVSEHFASAMVFMYVWGLLPLVAQSAEPKDQSKEQLLERLSARIGRAVISRTVSNASGIYFAGVVIYALVFTSRPSLLVPVAVTLGGATIATGHKTWTRLRKLSTQLYGNIRTLERDLQMISSGNEKAVEMQDAARRSWDTVELDLWTSVDTGYALFGTPFLPPETTNDLRERIEVAIEALVCDAAAAKEVLDDLGKIREACTGRLDSVA